MKNLETSITLIKDENISAYNEAIRRENEMTSVYNRNIRSVDEILRQLRNM